MQARQQAVTTQHEQLNSKNESNFHHSSNRINFGAFPEYQGRYLELSQFLQFIPPLPGEEFDYTIVLTVGDLHLLDKEGVYQGPPGSYHRPELLALVDEMVSLLGDLLNKPDLKDRKVAVKFVLGGDVWDLIECSQDEINGMTEAQHLKYADNTEFSDPIVTQINARKREINSTNSPFFEKLFLALQKIPHVQLIFSRGNHDSWLIHSKIQQSLREDFAQIVPTMKEFFLDPLRFVIGPGGILYPEGVLILHGDAKDKTNVPPPHGLSEGEDSNMEMVPTVTRILLEKMEQSGYSPDERAGIRRTMENFEAPRPVIGFDLSWKNLRPNLFRPWKLIVGFAPFVLSEMSAYSQSWPLQPKRIHIQKLFVDSCLEYVEIRGKEKNWSSPKQQIMNLLFRTISPGGMPTIPYLYNIVYRLKYNQVRSSEKVQEMVSDVLQFRASNFSNHLNIIAADIHHTHKILGRKQSVTATYVVGDKVHSVPIVNPGSPKSVLHQGKFKSGGGIAHLVVQLKDDPVLIDWGVRYFPTYDMERGCPLGQQTDNSSDIFAHYTFNGSWFRHAFLGISRSESSR